MEQICLDPDLPAAEGRREGGTDATRRSYAELTNRRARADTLAYEHTTTLGTLVNSKRDGKGLQVARVGTHSAAELNELLPAK